MLETSQIQCVEFFQSSHILLIYIAQSCFVRGCLYLSFVVEESRVGQGR
jgi:hypothetical protein